MYVSVSNIDVIHILSLNCVCADIDIVNTGGTPYEVTVTPELCCLEMTQTVRLDIHKLCTLTVQKPNTVSFHATIYM